MQCGVARLALAFTLRRSHGAVFLTRAARRGTQVVARCRCVPCSLAACAPAASCAWRASAVALAATRRPTDPINEARDALRKRDAKRAGHAAQARWPTSHPLALWVDYWELATASARPRTDEVEAFYQRWRGTYVEDRCATTGCSSSAGAATGPTSCASIPRFRMNDDREVTCYCAGHRAARRARTSRRRRARRGSRSGTPTTAARCWPATLVEAKVFGADDIWRKLRLSVEADRPRAARQAARADRQASVAPTSPSCSTARRATCGAAARRRSPQRRRAGDAGADPRRRQRPRCRRRRCWTSAGSSACRRRPCRLGLGGDRQAGGDRAAARGAAVLQARVASLSSTPRARSSGPTTCSPGRRAPRCAPAQRRPLAQVVQAIDAMSASRAARPGLGLLEGARAAAAGQRLAGRRGAARPGRELLRRSPGQLHLLRQAGRRGARPARAAAAGADAERRRPRAGAAPIRASAARCS